MILQERNRFHITPSKSKRIDWSKGNGITLFGASLLIVTFLLFYMLVQVFMMGYRASSLQQAVDNASDSVAVYMASEGEDFDDARNKTQEIVSEIRGKTGVDMGAVSLDPADFEDNIVTITAQAQYGIFSVSRLSSTYFDPGAGLRDRVVSYALTWVGVTPYNNTPARQVGYAGLVNGTDCWGFTCSVYMQFFPFSDGMVYTSGSAYGTVFTDFSQLLPGDIIVYPNVSTGAPAGHVAMYIGNGLVVNHGGSPSTPHISAWNYRSHNWFFRPYALQ